VRARVGSPIGISALVPIGAGALVVSAANGGARRRARAPAANLPRSPVPAAGTRPPEGACS